MSATHNYPNKESLVCISITMLDRGQRDLCLRLWLSTIVGSSLSVSLPLATLLYSWDGSHFDFNEREEKKLHCNGLKWAPREFQTNFCWTIAKTKPEMCTVLIKCRPAEEQKRARERRKEKKRFYSAIGWH